MKLHNFMLDLDKGRHKIVFLYRLHLLVIVITLCAILIDIYTSRYTNVSIEIVTFFTLILNLFYLHKCRNYKNEYLKVSVYRFIIIIALLLFTLIYMNHFATMSVIFILLLPLTTLIFLSIKETILVSLLLLSIMAVLLYIDSLYSSSNIFVQNPMALFNLAYTLMIIYSFGLIYHWYMLKTFKALESANHQKVLLLKEVHHRVKNNLNVISSIIGLQEITVEGKAKEELKKSQSRIESIALVHEMLYTHEDFQSIDFKDYMQRLTKLLLSMYVEKHNIKIELLSTVKALPLDIMVQLGIMVNECVTNSIKYAFILNEGEISIQLNRDDEMYVLNYVDNGIGHSSPKILLESSSLGIKLIHLTARQLKGSVVMSSPKGLQYNIRFKI